MSTRHTGRSEYSTRAEQVLSALSSYESTRHSRKNNRRYLLESAPRLSEAFKPVETALLPFVEVSVSATAIDPVLQEHVATMVASMLDIRRIIDDYRA